MRKRFAIANWKMNTTYSEAVVLANAIKKSAEDIDGVEIVICPPSIWLYPIMELYNHKATNLKLGAQNMFYKEQGTFTGEVSPTMLQKFVDYVILGHSERRIIFGESNELINDKVISALKHNLTPIVCIGEVEKGEQGKLDKGIIEQIKRSLENISQADIKKIVLAYEPVWAISSGNSTSKINASSQYVSEAIWLIREEIKKLYGSDVAEGISILYGGSVNKDNVDDYAHLENVDGALVGAASLKSDNFSYICQAIAR